MSTELTISEDKIALIKKMFAVGASDQELEVFLHICRRTGLDPLARQIYFVKRGGKMVNQTGIDGYRVVADRTGRYAGNDDPVFDREDRPTKATVTVYKLVEGQRCAFTATARWDQYYPGKGMSPLWDKMPHLMLGKCAEALALRKAFPQDLSGLYTKEEMDQADRDTPKAPARQYAINPEEETLPKDKFVQKKLEPVTDPEIAKQETDFDDQSPFWIGKIKEVTEHRDPTGKKDWVLYRVTMEDETQTATTFKQDLAADAKIIAQAGTEVKVLIEDNKRKPGTWTYLGFEEVQPALWPPEKDEKGLDPF